MNKQAIVNLSAEADTRVPSIVTSLLQYKQAVDSDTPPTGATPPSDSGRSIVERIEGVTDSASALGKQYGGATGWGAGAGLIAGIPIALLANALFGKDKSLRGHLRSALLGGTIGAGVGAAGGAGAKYMYNNGYKGKMDSGIDSGVNAISKLLGRYDYSDGAAGPTQNRSTQVGNRIKDILGT